MKVSLLDTRNASYKEDCDLWLDYWALYRGGQTFQKRIKRFLFQNAAELPDIYESRCREAHYRCYLGPIVDYFGASLFSSKLQRASKAPKDDEFYEAFDKDADGTGTNLDKLLRDQFVQAATKGTGFWALDFPTPAAPDPTNRKDWKEGGFGDITFRAFKREEATDWCKTNDQLDWIIFKQEETKRLRPTDEKATRIQHWWVYDATEIVEYEHRIEEGKTVDKDAQATEVRRIPHTLGKVPVTELCLPDGTWIADRLASPQTEHFRISSGQNWGIRRTCYALAVFQVKDKDKPPVMGAGYYMMCDIDEKLTWAAPPSEVFGVTQKEAAALKDEIYRIVNQMAQGVDNNAAAVGRSGESKTADFNSMRVILTAYGINVREFLEKSLNLLAKARGEDPDWKVSGLDQFQNIGIEALLEIAESTLTINVGSPTYDTEIRKRIAAATLPGATEDMLAKINTEIEGSTAERHEHEEMMRDAATEAASGGDSGNPRRVGGAGHGGGSDRRGPPPGRPSGEQRPASA